jgi:chromosome segregation ATPase
MRKVAAPTGTAVCQLERRIREHQGELANQEATARAFQSELTKIESERSKAQPQSKRERELRVYIPTTKWNIQRERTAMAEEEAMLQGARRSLVTVRQTLRQIDQELNSSSQARDPPAKE